MASLRERLVPASVRDQISELREQVVAGNNTNELLQESIAALELAAEDIGWQRLIARGVQEFSRAGLTQISAACRLYALSNALIKRGLSLRTAYVWGQGVEVTGRANGQSDSGTEQDVNSVLQGFLDDVDNRRTFSGAAAQARNELSLGTDGNVLLSLWTKPLTGHVQVRILPWDEILDTITNPGDRSETWFFHRRWTEYTFDAATGERSSEVRDAYYPAVGYRPATRPKRIGTGEVRWDAPVRHVKVNALEHWKFGVPDAYAAINWARAYKDFLEDWAKLVRSLSKFAWRTTARGATQGTAMQARYTAVHADPGQVAGTAVMPEGIPLEAIPKTGATIDSESGRPLAMMVASALGVPVTMLLGDPGQTGARAVAETLDLPTRLEMQQRQQVWTEAIRDVCEYVVRESVRAPRGDLKGTITRDEYDREIVALAGDTEPTIDVAWPDLADLDPTTVVQAIVQAASTGTVPPEQVLRLLLTALGVRSVDEIVDEMVDAHGDFQWPNGPPVGVGHAAAGLARTGGDPAGAGAGPMTPNDQLPDPAADNQQGG